MLAATFIGRYTICNTLYREMKFQRRHFLNYSSIQAKWRSQLAFSSQVYRFSLSDSGSISYAFIFQQTLLNTNSKSRVADKQPGKYNGGMKRRLSVSFSQIGDLKVVYMDEHNLNQLQETIYGMCLYDEEL
nr:ABC transporter A family member 7-like isoform X2 [Tanacetum cinerariifolium]